MGSKQNTVKLQTWCTTYRPKQNYLNRSYLLSFPHCRFLEIRNSHFRFSAHISLNCIQYHFTHKPTNVMTASYTKTQLICNLFLKFLLVLISQTKHSNLFVDESKLRWNNEYLTVESINYFTKKHLQRFNYILDNWGIRSSTQENKF